MLEIMVGSTSPRAFMDLFDSAASVLMARFFLQLAAEAHVLVGDRRGALEAVRRATQASLYDVAWMDLCPLLAEIRDDPVFVEARRTVAERAARVEEAYRAPLP
jgi:hypothetical protein